jgi:hypothetical protein
MVTELLRTKMETKRKNRKEKKMKDSFTYPEANGTHKLCMPNINKKHIVFPFQSSTNRE